MGCLSMLYSLIYEMYNMFSYISLVLLMLCGQLKKYDSPSEIVLHSLDHVNF